jgi:hypothetical protein
LERGEQRSGCAVTLCSARRCSSDRAATLAGDRRRPRHDERPCFCPGTSIPRRTMSDPLRARHPQLVGVRRRMAAMRSRVVQRSGTTNDGGWANVLRGQNIPANPPFSRRVSDGIRTHDRLDHNQELYQLSYAHREATESSNGSRGGERPTPGPVRRRNLWQAPPRRLLSSRTRTARHAGADRARLAGGRGRDDPPDRPAKNALAGSRAGGCPSAPPGTPPGIRVDSHSRPRHRGSAGASATQGSSDAGRRACD